MTAQRIPKSRAHLGLLTRQLIERCTQLAPHEQVTYAELSALVGVDVQQRRDLLDSARRALLTEHGLLFDVVTNQGLVRLDNATGLSREERLLTRQHAASKRMATELQHGFDLATMTPTEKLRYLGHQTLVAAVGIFTSPATQRHMESGGAPPLLFWDVEAHHGLFTERSAKEPPHA